MASEFPKLGKKRGSLKRKALISPFLALYASASFALPTGNELVAGQASVTTPAAGQLQINQSSQQAIINWQGFSIGAHESVNIQQPNASAVQLDRVIGQDASNIQGQLNANGQVFLINPNGVIFSKTAQVDVGGLIASTHSISNADFLNGKLHFTQDNAQGSVINQGQINTPKGGIVALIGEQVQNSGAISTPEGATVLAAGKTIDLDIQGNGLVEVKISEAAYNAQINNNGIIQADGGQVILTAQAAGQLLNTVINNQGVIEAHGLAEKNGAIVLSGGDNGIVQAGGVLDVSGQAGAQAGGSTLQGGTITLSGAQIQVSGNAVLNASGDAGGGTIAIGDKQSTSQASIEAGASLTAQALDHGKAGSIAVLANMANGAVKVGGQLNASAPKQGDGGTIETSAAHVKIADSAQISTLAANGTTGEWTIDPADFTIAASGGDMTGAALSASLTSTGVTIFSTSGGSGVNGDVNVNDVVSWSANLLTLNAQRNININANMNGSGTAQLALQYGQSGGTGNYFMNNGAKVTLPAGLNFSTQEGSNAVNQYMVITSLGSPNSITATDLQGMNGDLTLSYALGGDINASATSGWNSGAGFTPIGSSNGFSGNFAGLGHTITGLTINSSLGQVGLFGQTNSGSTISNLGLLGGSVIAASCGSCSYAAGALVGANYGTISNAYSTGSVAGNLIDSISVGGLVGLNFGAISNAYATGNVSGVNYIGGLVGENFGGSISNAYATGNVSGVNYVGGLVGFNNSGDFASSINNTYASGMVTGSSNAGGLVGVNNFSSVSNSFWDTNKSGTLIGIGSNTGTVTAVTGLGASFNGSSPDGVSSLSTGSPYLLSSYSIWNTAASNTIANTGGSTAVWRIYDGYTAPLLRSFLIPLTVTANADTRTYNGLAYTGGNGVSYTGSSSGIFGSLSYGGSSQGAINPGSYVISPTGLYSNQQGYDISYVNAVLTINPPPPAPVIPPPPAPIIPVNPNNPAVIDNIAPLAASVTYQPPLILTPYVPPAISVNSDLSVKDTTADFAGNTPQYCGDEKANTKMIDCRKRLKNKQLILPVLMVKNSAGRVKCLQISANKQFLSLLLEDGSVRIWDFQRGEQHQIVTPDKKSALTDISAVDNNGDLISIASKAGIGTQEVIIPAFDNKLMINGPDIRQFMASNDGSLLLVSMGSDQLSLWDNKQNKRIWQAPYKRGVVNGLALSDNKRYGAVLSRQPGSYVLEPGNLQLKSLTDAVDIVDLSAGKVIKSLPNVGDQIIAMQFTGNDTLQLKLASGELLNWSIAEGSHKIAGAFGEPVIAVDDNKHAYAYVLPDGTVRVGNGQGHVLLSIKNEKNPFKDAILLEGDKKLLTVMSDGELSLWDVASGKKMLRLFSTQQGWTVMDAFGRFDGSEEAMDNFSWMANQEDIPLDSFSENYYEPGLLSNVLQNQDYLNSNPFMVKEGISLPPKVDLQLAGQQEKAGSVVLQLDVYDRGGGIDQVKIYQNGKILNNADVVAAQQTQQDKGGEHRTLTLNVTPSAGKNTVKVIASNDMGIENSSAELSFDGKTKAYAASLRLLTIGIDRYSDPKLDLDYSVTDANSIGQAIKNSSKIASVTSLYNENATKPKILSELKELSQGAQQDVLVIYFAGHGMALGKEWYFLPYETTMQPTLEKIAATGITATELSNIFKDSKIQHILLMVDSCYSGAGLDAFSKLQIGQHYFTRKLSRSLGITVITAAAKDQEAYELKSLGHGLFTYLMTQELQEKNAAQPATAHGIAESIVKTLPVFSKKVLGSRQEPVAYTKGNDFTLTDESKAAKQGDAFDNNTPAIAPEKLDQ